ncbi:MAG: indolepyruvate oxidoreductase subunit beta [Myxococcales bacterium]|nr:MAG: indolepyruvate oxidoreductase subunit beta [Myxococcales bacterium]
MTSSGKTTNILVVGVGGQGIILASEVLSMVALDAGFDVKKSEVHGMAQRGGSVNSMVRFGPKVHAPIIPSGETDILLAFEKLEPLRWLKFCHPATVAIVNDQTIHSLTTATSLERYPENVDDELRARFSRLYLTPAAEIAGRVGNPRVVNVILLGLLSRMLDFPEEAWLEALKRRLSEKILAINLAAFAEGRALA